MCKNNLITFLLIVLSIACSHTKQTIRQSNKSSAPEYILVNDWWKEPKDSALGQISAVAVNSNQDLLVFRRSGRIWTRTKPFPDSLISLNTVFVFDGKSGNLLYSWGANMFIMPHGITVDNDNNVWITDVALQQVFKFTNDGKLLMTLGVAKTAGNDSTHFNLPTDVMTAKDGSFYVSDGYGNSRVIKYSKEGKYLFEWGTEGSGNGEFELPHAVDLDSYGNVYVADRENNRIQKFNAKGQFLKEWKNNLGNRLYSLAINDKTNKIIAVDFALENKVLKGADVIQLDTALNLQWRFGRSGMYNGPVCVYHDVAIDKSGNIYTANVLDNTIQKFKKVLRK